MGGGDLNMKKSWHPVLLVNQERVWKAEKAANDEKKQLAQLRKEREEERQLAELQKLQEAATGKKRVDKLDWMYAAPGMEGGALGGARIGEKEMEDYLLGKKRVDEVLGQGDKNIGNTHKEFQAVQNANTVRDTASKIREDPLLAIKRQELAAMEAMKNRPEIRKKMLEMQNRGKESKEERREKKRAEKEERRRERQEIRDRRDRKYRERERGRDGRDRSRSRSRTPLSDYDDDSDRDYKHSRRSDYRDKDADRSKGRYDDRDRRDRDRDGRRYGDRDYDDRRSIKKERSRSRSYSPRRGGDRRRDSSRNVKRERDEREDPRIPPPRQYPTNGHHSGARSPIDVKPVISGHSRTHPQNPRHDPSSTHQQPYSRPGPSFNSHSHSQSQQNRPSATTAEERAAKLAAMQSSASDLDSSRTASLAQRAEEEKREMEKEERMRKKYTKDDVKGVFFGQKSEMGLSETLGRRNGVGLQRDI